VIAEAGRCDGVDDRIIASGSDNENLGRGMGVPVSLLLLWAGVPARDVAAEAALPALAVELAWHGREYPCPAAVIAEVQFVHGVRGLDDLFGVRSVVWVGQVEGEVDAADRPGDFSGTWRDADNGGGLEVRWPREGRPVVDGADRISCAVKVLVGQPGPNAPT